MLSMPLGCEEQFQWGGWSIFTWRLLLTISSVHTWQGRRFFPDIIRPQLSRVMWLAGLPGPVVWDVHPMHIAYRKTLYVTSQELKRKSSWISQGLTTLKKMNKLKHDLKAAMVPNRVSTHKKDVDGCIYNWISQLCNHSFLYFYF